MNHQLDNAPNHSSKRDLMTHQTTTNPGPRRNRFTHTALAAATVALAMAAGCSAEKTSAQEAPAAAVGAVATPTPVNPDAVVAGVAATAETVPVDTDPNDLTPADVGVPDEPALNTLDEPITLDETGVLACANNQVAWVAQQEGQGDVVVDKLELAAERAEISAVASVRSSTKSLRAAAKSSTPMPEIERFLKVCTDRGFEY